MVLIPAAFFAPVFVRQWSRLRGSIDPLASPDLRLWHRMLCVLLAYIFLVGPEAFHMLARAESQYANLGISTWGQVDRTITYTYDANGNRTARFVDEDSSGDVSTGDTDVTEYEWDHRGRLVKVTDLDTSLAVTRAVDYVYDPLDQLVAKLVDSAACTLQHGPPPHRGHQG